ncbi:MAG: TonB-dependent receptor plug domain-containing protein, partial [Candidatus Saccharibacteria bacterium]
MKKVSTTNACTEVYTFRRWGRKAYSLFSVLKKPVRIGVLMAVYTSVAEPELLFAQTDSSRVNMEYNLDEVEVSAQRAPVAFSQVARIVSVIKREEIEAAPVQSLQELLEYALSVDVRQRGAQGVQADISVRGGSMDQTLILLNGINISDPQTGHHSLNLPVSLKNIQRIEILEGPAARVFGPNAFSGAINIITSSDEKSNLRTDVSAGQHALADFNISGNLKLNKWTQFAAFNRMSSDGYIENTDFKIWNAFYQSTLKTKPGTFDIQGGRTNKDFGANSFYTATYPNQFEATKTTFASLKFAGGTKIHWSPSFYWRRHQDRFELFRSEPSTWPTWYKGHNYHLTDVLGGNLNTWFESALGKTALGAELRSENIKSNVLGEPLDTPEEVPGEPGQFFSKSYSRTITSFFVEHSVYLNNLAISAGAMANHISDLDSKWNIYPGADMSFALTENFKLFGSANASLRMPTFTDLFYNGPTNVGNPNLRPEKSTTLEGGLKFTFKGFSGRADVYQRKGKDLIDWVRENETEKWQTRNLTRITSKGFEMSSDLYPEDLLGKPIFITKIGVNYAFNKLDKGNINLFSYYVLDNLKNKLDIELNHKIWGKLKGSWRVTYQDRNGMRTQTESYEPFWLVNSRIMWKGRHTEYYLLASNLFDTKYYDFGVIQQPG